MSSPLVSVALCTCNGEAYIEAQLASVLAQTHHDLDVVVVDDASTDRTTDIVEAVARRDPRVQLHRNPRRLGVNANFARAFGLCRGDFIAPCDQDDLWSAGKLEALLAAIGTADLAYGDSAIVDSAGVPTGKTLGGQRRMVHGKGNLALVFENSVSGHAALFRNGLAPRAMPFPEGVWYDGWMALAAVAPGGVVMHIGLQDWASEIDMRKLTLAEVTLLGTYTYSMMDLKATVAALSRGVFGSLEWVERRALADGAQAFQDLHHGRTASAKVVLQP